MGRIGNGPNKGFIKELESQTPSSPKKPFNYSKPVVKPELKSDNTMRRIQGQTAVAKPKSNIVKETLIRQEELRKKHSK